MAGRHLYNLLNWILLLIKFATRYLEALFRLSAAYCLWWWRRTEGNTTSCRFLFFFFFHIHCSVAGYYRLFSLTSCIFGSCISNMIEWGGKTKLFLFLLNLPCSPTCTMSQGVSVRGWNAALKINVILWTGVLMKALHVSVHVFNLRCFALLPYIYYSHLPFMYIMGHDHEVCDSDRGYSGF